MKKFLSFTLMLAILLTTVVVGVVSASAETYDAAITVGTTTYVADIGETFTYTVLVKCDKALSAGQLELPVDFAYLSGDSEVTLNDDIDTVMPVVADSALVQRFNAASTAGLKGYVFNFASDSSYDFTTSKIAFTIKLKVLRAGNITLNPVLREFLDDDGNDIIDIDGNNVYGTVETSVEVTLPKMNNYAVKAPRITSFVNYANGMRLNWNACDGAYEYRVFRKENGKWTTIDTVNTTYYLDKNVESGVAYSYTVRALNQQNRPVSDYVTAGWTNTYFAPPVVTGFDSLENGLQFTWDAVNGAFGYRVFRKDDAGRWQTIGETEELSFVDPDVVPGTQYTYTLRCMNSSGELVSAYNTTGFSAYYLGAPVLISVSPVYGAINVKWQAMNGAEKYRVFRKDLDDDTGWFVINDTTATSYNDKVVDSNKSYAYTVRCISADGTKYTSIADRVGLEIHYIAAPTITKLANVAAGTVIQWGAEEGAVKYRVFRKEGTAGWKKIADTAATTFTDKNVKSGTTYYYTVRCISEDGATMVSAYNTKGWKNIYLSAPNVTAVGNYVGYVRVNWAKMTGAARYAVFRKEGNGGWKKIGTTTGIYWNDKTVVSGKSYRYTVRCCSADAKTYTSPFNNGRAIKYIAAPVLKSVAKVSGGVKVIWAKSAGAAKYRILRKVGNGKWTKLADTTALYWTDKKVSRGYKYTYTVRCISADGKSYTSAYNTTGKYIVYR